MSCGSDDCQAADAPILRITLTCTLFFDWSTQSQQQAPLTVFYFIANQHCWISWRKLLVVMAYDATMDLKPPSVCPLAQFQALSQCRFTTWQRNYFNWRPTRDTSSCNANGYIGAYCISIFRPNEFGQFVGVAPSFLFVEFVFLWCSHVCVNGPCPCFILLYLGSHGGSTFVAMGDSDGVNVHDGEPG